MVIKRYIKGIAFVVLMLSIVLIAMAAASVLTTIMVSPSTASKVVGSTQTFTAAGLDQNGSSISISPAEFWNSSNTTVGTIDSTTGVFNALAAGTTTITAANGTGGTVSGTASVTVTGPTSVLTTITVSPSTASKVVGNTQTFTAAGLDQNGVSISISPAAFWNSSNTTVGTIDSTTGVFNALAAGTTTITATNGTGGTVSGTASVTVTLTPVLTTITVSPATASKAMGSTQTFTAAGLDQNSVSISISPATVWNSSNATVGTIDSSGLFTALAAGTTTITATNGSGGTVSGNASVTVTPPSAPDPVSGLTVAGRGATWINWTWTNPGGSFNYTMVNINGSFYTNTSNNYVNYTSFGVGTSNTISLQTVDTFGSVSSVVSNQSSTLNTQGGTNVMVSVNNVNVTFSQLNSDVNTSVNVYSTLQSGWGSPSFTPVGNYYDISLSSPASSGTITIEVSYNPAGISNESGVRLYHWNGASWDDVTTYVDTVNNRVRGNVTSLSPLVPAVSPPNIIKDSPTGIDVSTIGTQAQTFQAHSDQTANITWSIDGTPVFDNGSIITPTISTYTNSAPTTGSHNVTVTATNTTTGQSNSTYWNWTVHSKAYATGNRIWDGSKDMSTTYTWNPMSFYAFYYDVDNNVGNEMLTITLNSKTDRSVPKNALTYFTDPENVTFQHSDFGSYNVIGFMAEKYFAGYISNTSTDITNRPISTINSNQIHKVLMDDDTQRAVYAGGTLTLSEGYVLKVKDVDITGGKIVLLSLIKDGGEVDTTAVAAGSTYVYSKRVGSVSNLPIIAAHISTVFAGREANAAFVKGVFQISESYTSVNTGNNYGIMQITAASDTGISMSNQNSFSLTSGSIIDIMGNIKIQVADNDSVLRFAPIVQETGTYEARGTIAQATDNSFDWNPLNFEGFYYNIDSGVGTEDMTINRSDRTISKGNLVYTTTPQPVSFKHTDFGSYNVVGFMADQYFAGYTTGSTGITSTPKSTLDSQQLQKVLIDDDTQHAVYAGSTLTLNEGYVLKVKDVDITGGKIVLLSLLKDGTEVDTTATAAGSTYVYTKKVGSVSDLPIIAVHIATVFSGTEANAAFMKGIFQISESYTSVHQSDTFGVMEVDQVSSTKIQMSNPNSVTLEQGNTVDVMGNIQFKVADSGDIRYYPFIEVNGTIFSASQLVLDVPANPMVRDTINITVTSSGSSVAGADVSYDNSVIGTTDSTGKLNYTLTRSGMHNITVTKLGYDNAVKTIQVAEYVDNRLSIQFPTIIDQGIPVSIKVLANGTAIPGASVSLDGSAIGTTGIDGTLNYSFSISGTHNLGASKDKYISVVTEVSIRMPFSDYKALDININPDVLYVNEIATIRSNVTNAGTKADNRSVELIVNSTTIENKSVSLAPGETREIDFTHKEPLPGNYTVEILGQKGLLQVREKPMNYLLVGGIATILGIIAIYVVTAKSKLSLEFLRRKLNLPGKPGVKGP